MNIVFVTIGLFIDLLEWFFSRIHLRYVKHVQTHGNKTSILKSSYIRGWTFQELNWYKKQTIQNIKDTKSTIIYILFWSFFELLILQKYGGPGFDSWIHGTSSFRSWFVLCEMPVDHFHHACWVQRRQIREENVGDVGSLFEMGMTWFPSKIEWDRIPTDPVQ